jgi:hypothetical protein
MEANALYLASSFPHHQANKNGRDDLLISRGHLWGGRFHRLVIGARKVTGGEWQESFRPRRLYIVWIWKVFGSMTSVGSYAGIRSPEILSAHTF